MRPTQEYSNSTHAGEPMTDAEKRSIRVGDGVRLITRGGLRFEGFVDEVRSSYRGSGNATEIVLAGRHFQLHTAEVYAVKAEDVVAMTPERFDPSPEELRDIIADISVQPGDRKPIAVSVRELISGWLKFDPAWGFQTVEFGGKSVSGYLTEFAALSSIKRNIAALVADGVLRAVTSGPQFHPSADDKYVTFCGGSRSGFVLSTSYEDSVATVADVERDAKIMKLTEQASKIVAARHADEVEAELARLMAEAGI